MAFFGLDRSNLSPQTPAQSGHRPSVLTHTQEEGSTEGTGILVEASRTLDTLEKQLGEWERERLLGGPYDRGGAVLTIQACCATCRHVTAGWLWFCSHAQTELGVTSVCIWYCDTQLR